MRIVDPYREENERALKWLSTLSDEEGEDLLRQAGIIDKRGNLAAKYRTPAEPRKTKPKSRRTKPATKAKKMKSARPRSAKPVARKRTAS